MQETILESAVFSAFLHEVVFSFPPPAALEFQHRLKEWKKLGISRVGPLDLRLSDSYQHHTVAVTAVVSAWLDSTYLSWNEALRTVKENWPEWGAPYLLAHLADGDDRHLEAAERLCAVRDPLLLRRLNHAKVRMQGTTLGDQVSQRAFLTVLRSIATHHPSLINLHHWATKAAFYRRFGQIAEMLSLLYQVHGDDPAKWTAVDTYESLVAAGSPSGRRKGRATRSSPRPRCRAC